ESFLILNFIQSAEMQDEFWDDFGQKLASLHRHSQKNFGLDHDNYIGSLSQSNKFHKSWADFFREERLEAQVKLARDNGRMGREMVNTFSRFYAKLDELFPKEPPALLHGDLWSGNFMVNQNGLAVIIDPAVYYGHREMDLAMSQLFGGFDASFYDAYQRNFPLENGWQQRLDYYNLYPLMVHVNLFGGSYLESVKRILVRF
ncbi:MAG: ketosamine-3-kinase, partial [Bacteroidetes bacterium]